MECGWTRVSIAGQVGGCQHEQVVKKEEKAYARYSLRLNFQPIIRPARNRVRVLHVVDELFEFSLQSPNDVDVFIKGGPRTRRRGCR